MSIRILNAERLRAKFDNMLDVDKYHSIMAESVAIVQGQAKALTPVDSGNLRSSIHTSVDVVNNKLQGRVYTNVNYAAYVEFGTGIKGNGSYPYSLRNTTLTYKAKGWTYYSDKEDKYIYTTGQVAKPYLYPAYLQNKAKIRSLFKNQVRKLLRDS